MCAKLSELKERKDVNLEIILSRFIFVLGHVAVCHLNYLVPFN
jgi:hypothetical protein